MTFSTRLRLALASAASLGLLVALLPPPGAGAVPSVGQSDSLRSGGSTHLVIDRDTRVVNGLVLRSGDSIEFRNGARLIFEAGGYADWQGTPTWTWSDDGRSMNLERDIEIFGEGHVMFHAGSAPSTIRFVEFDLQPNRELGHYPLHWHLAGDSTRGTLVEGTVVKHSTNRAYVPHGSHGITFRDTIAYDIEGSAYWWDPPVFQGGPDENNSDDIVYERALAHTVTNHWSDDRGFRLAAFTMSAGQGNVVRDSVARNVEPSHVKDCAGFGWPELSHVQERVWTFEDNATFESECHGAFVWQNGKEVTHVVDGFRGDRISHGAYVNDYVYRDVDVTGVEVHAVGWRVEGGRVGDVVATRSQFEGTVAFDDVTVDSLTIDNTGGEAVHYVFRNATGVRCEDVVLRTAVSGTRVTINGRECSGNDYTAPSRPGVSDPPRSSGTPGSSGTPESSGTPGSSGSGRAAAGAGGGPFSDVGSDHLFATSIEWMAEAGITRGCNPPRNSLFCPDASVTRGQFAAFARRALDLPSSPIDYFSDDEGSVFEGDVNALAHAGVTSGCGLDRFCPDAQLTRGEMAAFFDRMLDLPAATTDYFADDRESPFESSINALAAAGITKGCNPPANDRYCDGDSVTRGQLSAFLHRARALF